MRSKKITAAVLFATACVTASAQSATHHSSTVDTARINSVLSTAVAKKTVPNIAAIVIKDGHIAYKGSFGNQSDTGSTPVSTSTIYRIYSMTKPVTAVAVMQLVEAGKIKLDEPAATYLPAIGEAQVIDHIDAKTGEAMLRAPKSPVTIRQLLSHSSGFVYNLWDAEFNAYRNKAIANGVPAKDVKEQLLFDPGTRWEYGTSTAWLGRIVEAVTGQTLEQYFRAHILDPLNMRDTSFLLAPDKQSREVAQVLRADDGSLKEEAFRPFVAPAFFDGGGGLNSTAEDYASFMTMILAGGTLDNVTILKPESIRQMETNQIGGLTLQPFKSTNFKESINGTVPGDLDKFGLGFAITSKQNPGGRGAGSIAWAGLDNTFFWIDPKNKTAAVIMMQILPFLDPAPLSVLTDFEHAVYAPPSTHQ